MSAQTSDAVLPPANEPRTVDPGEPIAFDPWIDDLDYNGGGTAYADLLEAFCEAREALAASMADESTMRSVTLQLRDVTATLGESGVEPGNGFSGRRYDLPGRGHPGLVPAVTTSWATNVITADVRFDASHVGGRGAVHGGIVPLLFDELLGRLSNANREVPCRTAYLRTDYHRVTLPYVDYLFDATVDEEVGRKRFLSARLTAPDGFVVASAHGLFVALRNGAP
ncbi:hypothetical protein ASC77_19700 [Nocardioides sp. Root1257]|uniref:PaaI family thioesterase n=1 Tax=unclassified Nocardioides TaxID=2615069 RepID=UPI0006FD7B2C|nr:MULTISPECIES: PaaI family thioesterase [unclassified Nocardioides]KQW45011.1 hypothetical protein ASC77_19700 [Nocardioides sp. Root1257]KRC45985.1 hypothetical protein ASE24_15520 [Nocardioides sp. Root224]